MKLFWIVCFYLQANFQLVSGFVPCSYMPLATPAMSPSRVSRKAVASDQEEGRYHVSEEERALYDKFQNIAQKLRLSIHSQGFDSKDPAYGIERVCATIPVEPSMYVAY